MRVAWGFGHQGPKFCRFHRYFGAADPGASEICPGFQLWVVVKTRAIFLGGYRPIWGPKESVYIYIYIYIFFFWLLKRAMMLTVTHAALI